MDLSNQTKVFLELVYTIIPEFLVTIFYFWLCDRFSIFLFSSRYGKLFIMRIQADMLLGGNGLGCIGVVKLKL